MNTKSTIEILMATYNGARFLDRQLESLLGQTDQEWRLLIRDDGSNDATPEIISRFEEEYAGKAMVLHDGRGNLGAIGNFSALMEASDAEYVMFCDQDDVWLPEKIAKSRATMLAMESAHGAEKPLLVHTDLRLVGERLEELQASYFRHLAINPMKSRALERLLVQNIAPGCTMMLNRKLRELSAPVPGDALMHDWWAMLIAAALGAVDCIDEPLVLYRQHGANTVGARRRPLMESILELIRMPLLIRRLNHQHLEDTQHQAAALLAAFGSRFTERFHRCVLRYATIAQRNSVSRRLDVLRFGYLPGTTFRGDVRTFLFI